LTPPARRRKPPSKAAKRPRSEAKPSGGQRALPSEAQQNWLVKSDPESYGWNELVKEGGTRWDGVRNPEARNSLAAMQPGDLALFYHSGADKAVVGIAKVGSAAYPEPGADDPRWLAVDLAPLEKLARPVTLAEIKAERSLAKLKLVTHSRLSVMPVDAPAFERILALARSQPKR
jgi:predicted RNA-binding protein with PUA-like domain